VNLCAVKPKEGSIFSAFTGSNQTPLGSPSNCIESKF
jgi:hypothetical protein